MMKIVAMNFKYCNKITSASRYGLKLFLICTAMTLVACGSDDDDVMPAVIEDPVDPVIPARGDLESATFIASIGNAALDLLLITLKSTYGLDASVTRNYNVDFYKIVYTTVDAEGNLVSASGLVSYPVKSMGDPASPLLSFQHGTIASDDDAPSNIAAKPELGAVGALFSSQGFVNVMPDYLGYGTSTQLMHPYIIADSSASATIDLLRAVRTHAAQISHALDPKLFITGYSEGGYVTLATQKEIETNLSDEFTITKSIPAAGPYNVLGTAQTVIDMDMLPSPNLLSFVLKSYDTIYALNRITEIYQAPYAGMVNSGFFYGDGPDIILTDVTVDLLTLDFLYGPDMIPAGDDLGFRETGETALKNLFIANNLHSGWTASTPTVFFHGPDDVIVPYQNSLDAVAGLGAKASLVVCTEMPADHSNCAVPYVNLVLNEFGFPH